jgi:hypothetical protein
VSRLDSQTLVGALIRRVQAAGGFATVIHKGDPSGGVILVQLLDRGRFRTLMERMTGLSGHQTMVATGPTSDAQQSEIYDYISKRRRSDPDLWLIELDVAEGERFAAETLCVG